MHNFNNINNLLIKVGYFCNKKTAGSKNPPNGRKFAHSGHPVCGHWCFNGSLLYVSTQTTFTQALEMWQKYA
jgi:hypothetical protein